MIPKPFPVENILGCRAPGRQGPQASTTSQKTKLKYPHVFMDVGAVDCWAWVFGDVYKGRPVIEYITGEE